MLSKTYIYSSLFSYQRYLTHFVWILFCGRLTMNIFLLLYYFIFFVNMFMMFSPQCIKQPQYMFHSIHCISLSIDIHMKWSHRKFRQTSSRLIITLNLSRSRSWKIINERASKQLTYRQGHYQQDRPFYIKQISGIPIILSGSDLEGGQPCIPPERMNWPAIRTEITAPDWPTNSRRLYSDSNLSVTVAHFHSTISQTTVNKVNRMQ